MRYLTWCHLFGPQLVSKSTSIDNIKVQEINLSGSHVLQTQIHQLLGHCLVYKTVPNVMSTFLLG